MGRAINNCKVSTVAQYIYNYNHVMHVKFDQAGLGRV